MNARNTSAIAFTLAMSLPIVASAQTHEPLCVPVASQRLLVGDRLSAPDGERMAVQPFATTGPQGERFVMVVHENVEGLALPHAVRRHVGELGYEAMGGLGTSRPGRVYVRLNDQLHVVGEPVFVPEPVSNPPVGGHSQSTLPVAVTLPSGVLVIERIAGDVFATRVPNTGAIAAPSHIATAPSADENVPRGFDWITAVARGDGAIALAGTLDGQVVAMHFDHDGALQGTATAWSTRVGGPMQLLPSDGPIAALLGRPVRGTGPHNEQARVQILVPLDEALRPAGDPFATGFAQFPFAAVQRGRSMYVFQWSEQQGVAIATLPIGERRLGEQLPRLYYAQPALDGANAGHTATLAAGNIVYDVAMYAESQGGLHGHVAWLAPAGAPVLRRDVLALRLNPVLPPVALPASDGVVVFTAGNDEQGAPSTPITCAATW